jgi:hypothetical protein
MNYYFFLNHFDKSLNSSLDIFNFPPNNKFCKDIIRDIYPYAFYSTGTEWKIYQFNKIKKNEAISICKNDLPNDFLNESVFVSFSFLPNSFTESLDNLNYMNSSPQWRANTKIFNDYTSASYQGEYPGSMLNKKFSLVSCSPMIQRQHETIFYLINLTNNAKKFDFELEILTTKFEIIAKLNCTTNSVNMFNLNDLNYDFTDDFYVFKSNNFGGVPAYFTKSKDSKFMGIEHTHPPSEYIFLGDRNHFQKLKKKYWIYGKSI